MATLALLTRWTIEPSLDGVPEGGWVFSPAVHGRGLAVEAVHAALAWIDRHYEAPTTTCLIHQDNARSIHLAETIGYREYARSTFRNVPVVQFRRERP